MSRYDNGNDFANLFQPYEKTTVRPWYRENQNFNNQNVEEEVELDDTAPLPLLIGIGLSLFIGAVILILICCCCRRRRPPPGTSAGPTAPPLNQAGYQRAPVADGATGGTGMAYPMTAVPTNPGYQPPPHMGVHRGYGVIGSGPGMQYPNTNNHQFQQGGVQQQPPHFGGVPTFPPNQYIPSLGVNVGQSGPLTHPYQSPPLQQGAPSVSHSSQASTSSVSGATADPLVPPPNSSAAGVPSNFHLLQNQQHRFMLQQQQSPHQFMMPPGVAHMNQQFVPAVSQHQQVTYMSGRESPAVFIPASYGHMINNTSNAGGMINYHPAMSLPSAPPMPSSLQSSSQGAVTPSLPSPTQSQQPISPSSSTSHDVMSASTHADHPISASTPLVGSSHQQSSQSAEVQQPFLPSDHDVRPSSNSHTEGEEEEE